MKKTLYFTLILLLNLGSSSAQIFKSKVNPFPLHSTQNFTSQDSLKILAVLVEFQEDKYDATIGNGKFGSVYTQAYGDSILDPLPHDAEYFGNHLEFAQNYFRRVSNGKVNIGYNILPDVYTLSKPMRDYSPPYNSDDLSTLGMLSEEVWGLVDENNDGINFDDYDLFMIFHPGVSRGLDFGTYFLDRNLPSVYLSKNALTNIFGAGFQGFPVSNGNSLITNSIILPETESRELEAVDGSIVLLQLTINGLIVANIASYFGLPDLFDTETGLSVIGRLGLMDGQGIFANSGMFPPEPSPWEKIFLGWETPVTLPMSAESVNLVTRQTALASDTTLVKIPINTSEYYLVENRSQDANNDNSTITMMVGDELIQKTFLPDEDGYFSINPDSLRGVVVDVDEYDVSIPGNGIVIWHIDEDIINEKIVTNSINVDEFRRGVDIEEADGIQDVGVQFSSVFGTFINDGSFEDFWYSSNPATLYDNKFSYDTKPNTNSNKDAASLITFENFSDVSNRMSFEINYSSDNIELVSRQNLNLQVAANSFTSIDNQLPFQFLYLEGTTLHWGDENGTVINSFENFAEFKPAAIAVTGTDYIVGCSGSVVNLFVSDMFGSNIYSQDVGIEITAPPVISANSIGELQLLIGAEDGTVTVADVAEIIAGNPINITTAENSGRGGIKQICADEVYYSDISDYTFSDISGTIVSFPYKTKQAVLTNSRLNHYVTVILTEQNRFYIIENSSIVNEFSFESSTEIESFIIADLFSDGMHYILFADGSELRALNFNGESVDNFPIYEPEEIGFDSKIVTADLNLDGRPEIIVPTIDGRIFAFSAVNGKLMSGYPLTSGTAISNMLITKYADPALSVTGADFVHLAVIDEENNFNVWKIASPESAIYWTQNFGSGLNRSYVAQAGVDNLIDDYFPKDRAYNWPNPVYGNETYIHYFVSEASDVDIKIFDLAGDLVAELTDFASGGFDHETVWNVSNVESGVYFARIQVTGPAGETDSKIIKIAVIK